MVKTWIDEVKWHHLDVPDFAEVVVAGRCGAGAVACPEAGTIGGEEGVAFAFERGFAGDVEDGATGVLEPAAKVLLFGLALGMEEAAEGYDAVAGEASVGGEDHVGGAGLGLDEFDVGYFGEGFVESMPLLCGAFAGGGMDVAGHPRIDDVVDVVEPGRAHEVRGPGCGEWCKGCGKFNRLGAHVCLHHEHHSCENPRQH